MAESNTKKDIALIGGLFLILIGLLVFGRGFTSLNFAPAGTKSARLSTSSASRLTSGKIVDVKVNTLEVKATLASTQKDRQKGLSGRDSLPFEEGMLFVFDSDGNYKIWMKDMEFAIDVIWVDKDKKVVSVASEISPEPGKDDDELTVYEPAGESRYILEMNAGLAEAHDIQPGDAVVF